MTATSTAVYLALGIGVYLVFATILAIGMGKWIRGPR